MSKDDPVYELEPEEQLTIASSELIVSNQSNHIVTRGNHFLDQTPKDKILQAVELANILDDIIKKQGLYVNLQGKKYVKAEGWNTLGTLAQILPKEREVRELPDGSYEAYVDLVRSDNGLVVGSGSALCGMDEKRWGQSQKYARRSMSITRATGKAYRNAFSWVMTLAGYQPTPAEEMDYYREDTKPIVKDDLLVYNGEPESKILLVKLFRSLAIDQSHWKTLSEKFINKTFQEISLLIEDGAK